MTTVRSLVFSGALFFLSLAMGQRNTTNTVKVDIDIARTLEEAGIPGITMINWIN